MGEKRISRREFLQISAMTAAGAALAGCCPAAEPEIKEVKVTVETEIEVEKEILPQGLFGHQPVAGDYLAQWRQIVDLSAHAPSPDFCLALAAISAAIFSAAIMLAGLALPVPAMSKAVP